MKGRFAPTPSGRMHLGNLFSALLAWLDARSQGGSMVFRVEDLDPDRCTLDRARQAADDLLWLGLDWDEGGVEPVWCQSQRSGYYEGAFRSLEERGLVYPCYCSPGPAAGRQRPPPRRRLGGVLRPVRPPDGGGARRPGGAGPPPGLAGAVPEERVTVTDLHLGPYTEDLARDCGDFILRRSDGVWAYQLAVVVDDALMGVTRVVRGADLLPSAAPAGVAPPDAGI